MLLQAEVFRRESARNLKERRVAAHNGAEHEPFGIEIVGESLLDAEIAYSHRKRRPV